MGFLSSIVISILQAGLFLWVFSIMPGLPPNVEFSNDYVGPSLNLEGALSINNKLNNAERLFENKIKGPEGFAVDKSELYMSVHGGKILKLSNGKLYPVLKIGQPCQGLWEERLCGRPLGMKFDQFGMLYFADAYYGVMKANLTSGQISTLVTMKEAIDDKVPMLPNSVDVGKDGTVYWTDSSTTHHLDDGLFIVLASATGRLLKYDPKLKKNTVLMDKIHFANGLALSMDESFIIVAETAKSRIWKYYLKGQKAGTKEIFVEHLPGFPDNLRRDEKGHFIVSLINSLENDELISMSQIQKFPTIKKLIARIMAIFELLFDYIDVIYPHTYWKKAVHWIGHFESLNWIYKDHVIIVLLDHQGNIIESLHATDGRVKGISDIILHQGNYYLGSPFNPYLGMVKAK